MPVEMNKQTATDVVKALADLGIECKYEDDMEAVLTGVDSAYSIADNFGSYYSWNGYYLSDLAAVKSAIAVEAVKHNELMAGYEKVKDAETGEGTAASEGDVLSGCTCRLQYDIANLEGMTGYVYVELP